MAKLYWRIKKNGRWTWTPAQMIEDYGNEFEFVRCHKLKEEA